MYVIPQPIGFRELWEDCTEAEWFAKGGPKGGHKYTRRVPIGTDPKTGRIRYRYYYSSTSLAHRVREGERINLRDSGLLEVLEIKGSKARVSGPDGAEREIELADLHGEMFAAWKSQAHDAAERIARQWARAHLRGGDLPSGNDAQARALWTRHRKDLAAAKVDEHAARSLVAFVVGRDGWDDAAKAAVTDLMGRGVKDAALVAANLRQIVRAAENLREADGGSRVTPAHVIEAALLRLPGQDPKGDSFPDAWAATKNKLASENIRAEAAVEALEATIASGESGAPAALLAYVKGAVKLEAASEARRMAEAFPSLREDGDLAKAQQIEARYRAAVAKLAPPARPDGRGATATVYIADSDGFPQPRTVRYRVVEADQVVASHLPSAGFKVNPAYPEGVQERVYHADKAEQDKVRSNADRFRPDLVHNTNPDAVNGAPLATSDGVVLGGNSRTMTMQLMYADGKGANIKAHLAENAYQFGLSKADVEGMKAPILVRELVDTSAAEAPKEELRDLVRRANESFTQGMDPRASQVALAARLPDRAIQQLAQQMGSDQTLNAFLTSGRPAKDFVRTLQQAGVIDRRNRSQYVRDDGLLNQDGRSYVERLLVGKMLPDPELLGELPLDTMAALARSAPAILAAKSASEKHDVTSDLRVALRTYVEMRYHGHKTLDEHLAQGRLGDGEGSILGEPPIKKNPRARVLLDVVLKHGGVNSMSRIFRRYADSAQHDRGGQVGLFGEGPSALDQLTGALDRTQKEKEKEEKEKEEKEAAKKKRAAGAAASAAEPEPTGKSFAYTARPPGAGARALEEFAKSRTYVDASDGATYRVTGARVERSYDGGEFARVDVDPDMVRQLTAETGR